MMSGENADFHSKDPAEQFSEIARRGSYAEAIEFQKTLVTLFRGRLSRRRSENICGIDASYDTVSGRIYAAASVFSYPALEIIEEATAEEKIRFPYVSGLLAFREGPAILKLMGKIKTRIDLLIFDGHGRAHPRGAGLASITGFLLGIPSIGCAKTRLVGDYREPARDRGSESKLFYKASVIGTVLRTRADVKPVFVSAGYAISLREAVRVTLNCCRKYRLPEPVRAAHLLSNRIKKSGPVRRRPR